MREEKVRFRTADFNNEPDINSLIEIASSFVEIYKKMKTQPLPVSLAKFFAVGNILRMEHLNRLKVYFAIYNEDLIGAVYVYTKYFQVDVLLHYLSYYADIVNSFHRKYPELFYLHLSPLPKDNIPLKKLVGHYYIEDIEIWEMA